MSAKPVPLPRRWSAALVACAAVLGLTAGPLAGVAHAQTAAATVIADGSLSLDGILKVKETVSFPASPPAQLVQKFETRENLVGDRQSVTQLSGISATAKGAAVTPAVSSDNRYTTVTIPTNGANDVVLSYTVSGAVHKIQSGTALRWSLLQGLSVPVAQFSGTVGIPSQFSYVKCTAGPPNSTVPCASAAAGTEEATNPTFRDGPRGEGEVVAIDVGFPPGAMNANEKIVHRWTFGRAFSASGWPLGLALGLLVLGGLALFLAHRRTGRDAAPTGDLERVGEFVPTGPGQSQFRVLDNIRPGHVGTVADERVDPIDVTATLVDLAVRGHLLISELPRESQFARTDWQLQRRPGGDALRPFEASLLDGIAPVGGAIRVSEVGGRVQESIAQVQDALYDEVVANGWYKRRPDTTRGRWTQLAVAALVIAVLITVALAAFTTFGLVGLALIVLALGLVFVAQEMPSRTPKGVALLGGLAALRSDLLSHPTNQLPPGVALREISELLPYTIVLGGTDRWLEALVASDTDADPDPDDLSWYHGPREWHLRHLPDSLRNFITTVTGTLFRR